jgi:hypothetical protein
LFGREEKKFKVQHATGFRIFARKAAAAKIRTLRTVRVRVFEVLFEQCFDVRGRGEEKQISFSPFAIVTPARVYFGSFSRSRFDRKGPLEAVSWEIHTRVVKMYVGKKKN